MNTPTPAASDSGPSHLPKSIRRGNRQYAAIPIRLAAGGGVEVLLITSRGSRRWIIPKGWPMKKKTHAEAAMIEAFEEAGVVGKALGRRPIGTYRYIKDAASGGKALMRVDVYMMQVSQQLVDWPEKGERDAQWLPPIEAAGVVTEKALGKILRKVPALCRRKVARKIGDGSGVMHRKPDGTVT